jgi:DNA polymerase elongation subunit (family B)
MHRKKVNNVGRRPNQRWYNRTKADFVNVMRRRMLDRTRSLVAKAMKEQLEAQ